MVNVAKITTATRELAAWIKASGKTSIIETKPTIFHGINPTLTYPPSGKTFALPRFCTQEMKQARQMNKIAIRQAKAGEVMRTYPKATEQDLQRLTSETIEDSYSRVEWINPKDGKVYNLLKQGETTDGKIVVRILDEQGAFIKETQLTPKKIVIIDDFSSGKSVIKDSSTMLEDMTHGDIVSLLAKRSNPYAHIELIDIHDTNNSKLLQNFYSQFDKLQSRIDAGEKIDFVSLSLGIPWKNQQCSEVLNGLRITPFEMKTSSIAFNHPNVTPYPASSFAITNKGNVRVIQGSANAGKSSTNIWLTYPGIEGVGSLTPQTGKIAGFSASRNSLYTQHYETGIFEIKPKSNGMSLTGNRNVDIPLRKNVQDLAKHYIGEKPIITTAEENMAINTLKKQAQEKYKLKMSELKMQYTTLDEKLKIQTIKKQIAIAQKNRDRAAYIELQKEIEVIEDSINSRIKPIMENFVCDEITAYRDLIRKLKLNKKVVFSGFSGEYHIPSENPISLKSEIAFQINKNGNLELQVPRTDFMGIHGTSFSTPIRTAKLALNDMMEGIL